MTTLTDMLENVHGDKDVYWLAAARFGYTLGISPMNFGVFGDKCTRSTSECEGFPLHYILDEDDKYIPVNAFNLRKSFLH